MKRIVLSLVCLFLSSAIAARADILPVQNHHQDYDQWCWAASSQAVLEAYGYPLPQAQIAQYGTEGLNNWNWLWGSTANPTRRGVDMIMSNFGGLGTTQISSSLNQTAVEAEISGRRPFFIRWGWPDNSGHILVGHGIVGGTMYVMDPWNGPTINSLAWVTSGSNHVWTHTLKINASMPGGPAATPTPAPTPTVTPTPTPEMVWITGIVFGHDGALLEGAKIQKSGVEVATTDRDGVFRFRTLKNKPLTFQPVVTGMGFLPPEYSFTPHADSGPFRPQADLKHIIFTEKKGDEKGVAYVITHELRPSGGGGPNITVNSAAIPQPPNVPNIPGVIGVNPIPNIFIRGNHRLYSRQTHPTYCVTTLPMMDDKDYTIIGVVPFHSFFDANTKKLETNVTTANNWTDTFLVGNPYLEGGLAAGVVTIKDPQNPQAPARPAVDMMVYGDVNGECRGKRTDEDGFFMYAAYMDAHPFVLLPDPKVDCLGIGRKRGTDYKFSPKEYRDEVLKRAEDLSYNFSASGSDGGPRPPTSEDGFTIKGKIMRKDNSVFSERDLKSHDTRIVAKEINTGLRKTVKLKDGNFVIKGLEAGEYTVFVKQERNTKNIFCPAQKYVLIENANITGTKFKETPKTKNNCGKDQNGEEVQKNRKPPTEQDNRRKQVK